jgi:hypothetical protein
MSGSSWLLGQIISYYRMAEKQLLLALLSSGESGRVVEP